LYNLRNDPGETHDLAKGQPKKLKELILLWDRYAKQNGLILTGDGPYKKGKERLVEDDLYE
jgi:arylsulfatase